MKHPITRRCLMLTALTLGSQAAFAGTETWFTPLTQSANVVPPNGVEELVSPWITPAGISQKNSVSLNEVENAVLSPLQSIIRVNGLGTSASMFDMLAYDPSGEYLFIPHETQWGAGVTRYSLYYNSAEVIFRGDGNGATGDWSNDFGAFDPCRFTPNGTLFLAEEWSGMGRVVEVLNPFAPADQIQTRVLNSIANVSHEGINFSKKFPDTIYFVDEDRSGSIYKFVMTRPGDYTAGQTFVLVVDAYAGSATAVAPTDATADRTGTASWVPLTDAVGNPLPGIDNPYVDTFAGRSGRDAADDANGTPYRRPEDMTVSRLANGNEVLYVAATEEHAVYSIEILEDRAKKNNAKENRLSRSPKKQGSPSGKAIVRIFASQTGTPKNLGFAATTGVLNSPDNVAIDAVGNIYVIEDAPNGNPGGGDIWFVRDTNNDGVGESLDHFMSVQVDGCEATGMIWNPVVHTEFSVCVMHPDSTGLAGGLGDAVWTFNVSPIDNQDFVKQLNEAEVQFGE